MKTKAEYEVRKRMWRLFRQAEECAIEDTLKDDAVRNFHLGVRLVVWLAAKGKDDFNADACLACPALGNDASRADAVLGLLCAIGAIAWDVEHRMEYGEVIFTVARDADLRPA